jgi:nucleotide-binding universal stress UspA family protein
VFKRGELCIFRLHQGGANIMIEIKKIIWATDGSKESEEALDYARFFAQRFNSEIIGVHVIEMPVRLVYDYVTDRKSEHYKWLKTAEEDFAAKLAVIANDLTSQGLKFRGEILKGEPYKEIVRFARNEKASLIVLGKRGLGLIDRMLVGSTTLRVLRESDIPVLAVRKRDEKRPVNIRNILVPLDIDEKVDSAVNYAIDLAGTIDANILVMYVFKLSIYDYSDYGIHSSVIELLLEDSSNELEKRIEEIKARRGIQKKGVDKLEISGEMTQKLNPAVAIVEYASSKNVDLVVINTHGRKGVKRLILGSITEKVIQESPCAVLTLKP